MKAFTTLASAAALAISLAATAAPTHAAVIAQFAPNSGASDYKWVRNGAGGHFFSITSNSSNVAQGVATKFSFLESGYTALSLLSATFILDATAANVPANAAVHNTSAGTVTQPGINGSFHVTYTGPNQVIGGFHLIPGENLLSGLFTDAWIQGGDGGGSGSANVTTGNGGAATYTSSVLNLANIVPGSEEFAFNLLGATPHFGASAHKGLNSFRANGGGNFSATTVPEPAGWALMILGFGGAGTMLRRRRRVLALAT